MVSKEQNEECRETKRAGPPASLDITFVFLKPFILHYYNLTPTPPSSSGKTRQNSHRHSHLFRPIVLVAM